MGLGARASGVAQCKRQLGWQTSDQETTDPARFMGILIPDNSASPGKLQLGLLPLTSGSVELM